MKQGRRRKISRPQFSFVEFTFKYERRPFIINHDAALVSVWRNVCVCSSRSFSFMIIPAQAAAPTLAMQWFMQRLTPSDPMTPSDSCVTLNMQHAHASDNPPLQHYPRPSPALPRNHAPRPRPTAQAATHREDHLSLHLLFSLADRRVLFIVALFHSVTDYLFKLVYIRLLFPDFSDLSMQDRCILSKVGSECRSVSLLEREKECVRVVSALQTGRPWDGSQIKN